MQIQKFVFLPDEKPRKYFPSLEVNLSVQGGIQGFSGDNNAVTKCTLGRSDQVKNINALCLLSNMKQQPYEYKHNRLHKIPQLEQSTSNVFGMLQNNNLNLSDTNLKSNVVRGYTNCF